MIPGTDIDSRLGLTSASNAEADALCLGRFLAQQGLPEESSEDATSGSRVHAAMAGLAIELSSQEAHTVERAQEIERAVVEAMFEVPPTPVREQRLWTFDAKMQRLHSGQLDAYWLGDDGHALIEEIKSLFGDVEQSASNLQLRDQAALLWEQEGCSRVTVFVNQPWVTSRPALVTYTTEDLTRAHSEMITRVERSQMPGQPRIAGEKQCQYCLARSVCPEAQATVRTLATLYTHEIAPDDLLKMLELVGPAKKVIAALEGRAKRLLEENPDILPGWMLEDGAAPRKVTDPQAAFQKLSDVLTPEQFAGCCTVKISELENVFKKVLAEKTGLKPKDCLNQFSHRLEGIILKKAHAPSLARAKRALPAPKMVDTDLIEAAPTT